MISKINHPMLSLGQRTHRLVRWLALAILSILSVATLLSTEFGQAPAWKPPYEILSAPADAVPYESRLNGKDTAIWLDGDVLNVVHKTSEPQVALTGGLQAPMQQITGSDLWVFRARMPDWDRASFSYTFLSSAIKPGTKTFFKTWYGRHAPKKPVKLARLRGRLLQRTLHSDSLGQDRRLTIYLPPNAPTGNLPAFFLADGQGCESFAKVLEPLILSHRVRPAAIIGVHSAEQTSALGKQSDHVDMRASEYLAWYLPDTFKKHMVFFTQELLDYAMREFGISHRSEDRAVVGFSNGGGFAFDAGFQHSEVFGHALPFSASHGIARPEPSPGQAIPHFHCAAGEFEYFSVGTKQFYDEVKRWNGDATLEIYKAGHDPEMWEMAFARIAPSVFPPEQE